MVEIAISIALVSFALVAIIGVLPTGLNVQRENREDTIIYQDATVLMEAIKGGAQSAGMTNLSANLEWITPIGGTTYSNVPPLTPAQVVSYLSTPRQGAANFCQARFRSFSGSLRDRDTNAAAVAFGFIVTSEINPVEDYSAAAGLNPNYSRYLSNNLHDVRLTFRWPVINGNAGNSRLTMRSLVSGSLSNTNNTNGFWFFQTTSFFGP